MKKNIVTSIDLLAHISKFTLSKRMTVYVIGDSYVYLQIWICMSEYRY